MKLSAGLALAAMFLTSQGSSMTYCELTARGGSRIYSLDAPVRKGRQLLFHRYPDGVYMSLSAAEVEKISPLEVAPPPSDKLAPGQTLFIGPAVEGPGFEFSGAPASGTPDRVVDSGYGASTTYWGGYIPGPWPGPRPGPPPRPVPTHIGPNGFPILAPPGSPGAAPPAIGPNGYPILAPPPPSRRAITAGSRP